MKLRRVTRRAEVRELREQVADLTRRNVVLEHDRDRWYRLAVQFDNQATSLRAELVDMRAFLAVVGSQFHHPSGGT